MKISQRNSKNLARLMLGLVLFAQGIIAAHACATPAANPMQMYAAESMPCHDGKQASSNVCLAHCMQPDQVSVDQHTVSIDSAVTTHSFTIPTLAIQHLLVASYSAPNTGPPLSIRFCSFLI